MPRNRFPVAPGKDTPANTLPNTPGWAVRVPAGFRVGRWTVGAGIATGAWGSVYEARADGSARDGVPSAPVAAAVKFIPSGHTTPGHVAVLRDMAESETRFRSRMSHPRLIRTLEIATVATADAAAADADGAVAIVMERAASSLEQVLDAGPVAPAEASRLIEEICEGLAHIHAGGWLHGDLKPANILLADDGSVRLADFGLSAMLEGTHAYVPPRASSDYTPPEFASAPRTVRGLRSRASRDVWALGVIAYRLLAGTLPFTGASASDRQFQAIRHARGEPSVDFGVLPARWRGFVADCLTPDEQARRRHTSAELLRRARTIRAAEVQERSRHARTAHRLPAAPRVPLRPRTAASAAVVLATAVALVGWLLYGIDISGGGARATEQAAGAETLPGPLTAQTARGPAAAPPIQGVPGGRADGTRFYASGAAAQPAGARPWQLPAAVGLRNQCLHDGEALYCTGVRVPGADPAAARDPAGFVTRIDPATGAVVWHQGIVGELLGVVDGMLLVAGRPGGDAPADDTADPEIVIGAHDTANGMIRWATPIPAAADGRTPAVAFGAGHVFAVTGRGLVALSVADGRTDSRWDVPLPFEQRTYDTAARFADGRVYLAYRHPGPAGRGASTQLVVVDPTQPALLARREVRTACRAGFAVTARTLHCADDGAPGSLPSVLRWDSAADTEQLTVLPRGRVTGFATTGGTYAVGLDDGSAAVVRTADGTVQWQQTAAPGAPVTVTIVDDRVHTASGSTAATFDLHTGTQLWRIAGAPDPTTAPATPPLVHADTLFLRTAATGIQAIPMTPHTTP
ncbi:protein kinase domain-containing protein [Yinghuangia soli]|uniref:non-specific serine/threonine protein kinase n=1 Tax=Yinghuangia soli TaxID=2908204 RepID=A0AA41Q8X5_9ACTN|nr:serine/threonine-protein kinase [Yinghuangia soli]MCF2533778.1 serine/threonine-protein kinase [Yinghuangia soli]